MAGVNKVILLGNLGSDPEIRHLPSGSSVATFNIATSESYTNKNGERVTQTEWHRIELWEGLAKIAEQYLKKGNSVYIEGKLKTESYTDKDGINRSTTKIRGTALNLIGGGRNTESLSSDGSNTNNNYVKESADQNILAKEGDIDDLPF
jgi:single-strand DNA-binding protein